MTQLIAIALYLAFGYASYRLGVSTAMVRVWTELKDVLGSEDDRPSGDWLDGWSDCRKAVERASDSFDRQAAKDRHPSRRTA